MSATPGTTTQDRASAHRLPLSKDPFQAPTDRDMLPSERRLFVQTHRTCVFCYGRKTDGPAMSIVYYVPDDNGDLLVATMGDRAKAPAELRPAVKALAEQEGRVLLRCRPYATFVTPPRHLHNNDQQELTHWVSASMPWDAADTPR
jgi:hypothetical protein